MSTRAGVPEPKNLRNPGHFGPAVIGGSKPQQPTAAQLKVQPELAAFERPEGPRKAAVRVLLKAEQEKAEPREDVVARLADAVKSGGVGGRSGTGPVPG